MALDGIQDRNAQRVQAGSAMPMLSASGQQNQHQAESAESFGTQTASAAAQTAQALGALAQDVAGNANAIVQKEQYVEAYANAGAGRSVAELRAEQPAWETLFGPSATVQGASARALQTAVAEFGNEGLAMVDQNKHTDPASFHKLLASTVSKHLTGDAITDQLITQKAIESTTVIAAAQYKAHAKYVQELNVQTTTDSIRTQLKSHKTMLALDPTISSPALIEQSQENIREAMRNPTGMNPMEFKGLLVDLIEEELLAGGSILRDIALPENTSIAEQKQIVAGDASLATRKAKARDAGIDEQVAELEQGQKVSTPLLKDMTEVEQLRLYKASEKRDEIIKFQHREDRAVGFVTLLKGAQAGASWETTLKGVAKLEATSGTIKQADYEELLKAHVAKDSAGTKASADMREWLEGRKNNAGRDLYFERIRNKYPGEQGERRIIEIIALRNEEGGVDSVRYQYDRHLNQPVYEGTNGQGGGKNPDFLPTYKQFRYHYEQNPKDALMHITNPETRATYHAAMASLDNGTASPESVIKGLSLAKPTTPRDITTDPDRVKQLTDIVTKARGAGKLNTLFGILDPDSTSSKALTDVITARAISIANNKGIPLESALISAGMEVTKESTIFNKQHVFLGNVPMHTQMGLADVKATPDMALKHFKEKNKFKDVITTINNGIVSIQQSNKDGIPIGPEFHMSLKELGALYNTEVTAPKRATEKTLRGETQAQNIEDVLAARMYMHKKQGKQYTREQELALYNKEQEHMAGLAKKTKTTAMSIIKSHPALRGAKAAAGFTDSTINSIKSFINGHEFFKFGSPKVKPNASTYQ